MKPTPKNIGVLIAGFNPLTIDTVLTSIMGFDFKKIPRIYQACNSKRYPISKYKPEDIKILFNNKSWDKKVTDIKWEDSLK